MVHVLQISGFNHQFLKFHLKISSFRIDQWWKFGSYSTKLMCLVFTFAIHPLIWLSTSHIHVCIVCFVFVFGLFSAFSWPRMLLWLLFFSETCFLFFFDCLYFHYSSNVSQTTSVCYKNNTMYSVFISHCDRINSMINVLVLMLSIAARVRVAVKWAVEFRVIASWVGVALLLLVLSCYYCSL